jgi:hypothetical protein
VALVVTRSQQRLKTVALIAEMGKGKQISSYEDDPPPELVKMRKLFRDSEKIRIHKVLERLKTVVLAQPDYGQLSKFKRDKVLKSKLEDIFVDAAKVTTACNPFALRVPLG